MKLKTAVVLGAIWATSLAAMAQWQWVDKDGRKVYSDRPPPADVPEKNILKQPGYRSAVAPAPAAAPASAASAAASAAIPRPSGKDKELEEKKKQAEQQEAAARKAEEERIQKIRARTAPAPVKPRPGTTPAPGSPPPARRANASSWTTKPALPRSSACRV